MPDLSKEAADLSPVKRALVEIRTLRARVEELEAAQSEAARSGGGEAIAIIGAGMRFPGGVVDAASFWELLAEGKDAITEIPRERWDWREYFNADADAPGAMYTQHGGFLSGVDLFDAGFFGISPREAVAMDPQHRLALEVGWEAIENSGYSPAATQGSTTGIFLGIANGDYGRSAMADVDGIDAYTGSGNSPAMVAGRLSYVLGLHGPSLAIDTSCSSSLVAVHLACGSLRAGECGVALAGGVNLILTPESNIALSKAHMMARDGRCKTFDAAADGYVRSEGCCIVVLKKLSDAVVDGDQILAVIRGSAVNHDGRSGGLTAPNGPAQAAVIGKALESAGVKASAIGYVETHGTGTALGDPIEVETLASLMGSGRPAENPLAIGAVKTNIGHAEAASGIAGLMKTVLALEHGEIPPSLHLKRHNPHIDWERLPVFVPVKNTEWKPLDGHRYAGVSSFGFSGTNAHVVLEEAPVREAARNARERTRHVLTVSARSQAALDTLRTKYIDALRNCPEDGLADLCFTANAGRAHFAYRLAVVGGTAGQMADGLETQSAPARVFSEIADGEEGRIGFLFTGQGSQYGGMGRELYESSPVFREAMERCAAVWKQETGELLIEVLYPARIGSHVLEARPGAPGLLDVARFAQPALFAFEYALAELWRSWGVKPSVLLGHSLGEYVAAVVAGVFSMEDGLRLVVARARLMDRLETSGAMRSVNANVQRVRAAIVGFEKEVSIAAVNGPESVVISGAVEAVARVAEKLAAEGIRTRALQVTHGFHSPLLEPILDEFEAVAATVRYRAPRIRMISNLTGETARAEDIATARYWREHMRSTVLFHAGLEAALATGCETFIEIGPQPHLKALAVHVDSSLETRIGISVRRQHSNWEQMLETLAGLYVRGQKVDWKNFDEGYRRVRVALPTYPFERQRYWPASRDGNSSERVWQRSTAAALEQSTLAPIEMHVESFRAKWECLRRLTIAEILKTLRELGEFSKAGTRHDAQSLTASCGILPAYTKLIARWLNLLCEDGYLERNGSGFRNPAPLPEIDAASAMRDAEIALSDDPYLMEYLGNCSKHLKGVLLGTTSPLETIFPNEYPDLARNLYEKSGGSPYANLMVAAAVEAACAAAPAGRRLRVLELGAGTGATTAAVLPRLPADRVSYYFTDISEIFLERAAARFAAYPFLRYGLLDIENEEHLARHAASFNVVVAANVVHATRDLEITLSGISRLLAPGGTLVLLETTKDLAWHDISIALTRGWQKYDDRLRPGSVLLGVQEWKSALEQTGFEGVVSAPESGSPAGEIGLHVILARGAAGSERVLERASASSDSAGESAWDRGPCMGVVETEPSAMVALLRETPSAERRGVLLDAVCREIGLVLRLPTDAVPKKRDRLMNLGMDSLMAVELRNRLGTKVGLRDLPATLMFDYPTPDAIAGYLLERFGDEHAAGDDGLVQTESAETTSDLLPRDLTAEEVFELPDEEIVAMLRSRLAR